VQEVAVNRGGAHQRARAGRPGVRRSTSSGASGGLNALRTGTFQIADGQVLGQIVAYRGNPSWVFMNADVPNYNGPVKRMLQADDPAAAVMPVTGSPAASGQPSDPATVRTASATVLGTTETILVNANGLPLYTYKADTPTTSHVTGQLAALWPPLIAATPTAQGANGTLTSVATDGRQVAYDHHFLYTFVEDSPGYVASQGVPERQTRWLRAAQAQRCERAAANRRGPLAVQPRYREQSQPANPASLLAVEQCSSSWPVPSA
jgi:predicted lipoprotein with Yx(FWY)xxD motif